MALTNFTYSISWSDFTQLSARPHGENEDAQIHPDISFSNFQLARNGRAATISGVDVNISLVSNDCWVVRAQMTNDLLTHEQGHYDIVALSAREFYNTLMGLSAASVHALQTKVTRLHTKFQSSATAVDSRYDTQTNHSRNTQKQQQWNKAITVEKQKLSGGIDNLPK